jgi:hypothetical protein
MNAMPPPNLETVAVLRARLWDAGFRPVALKTGDKMPLAEEWPERARRNPPADAVDRPQLDKLNTGILADGLRIVDIDVDNEERAGRLRALTLAMLGNDALIRTRTGSSRCALIYRAAEGSPRKRSIVGNFGKIEVLGYGQQLHAFGKHPSGAELQWHPEPPGEATRDALPAVTEEQISDLLVAVDSILGVVKPEPNDEQMSGGAGPNRTQSADPLDIATALAAIPNNGPPDWDHWNRIGMATWAASGGSETGFAAWCAWSAKNSAHNHQECLKRWNHYRHSPPTNIGAGTLFHLAREAQPGWTKPSDNARANNEVPTLTPITVAELLSMQVAIRQWALAPILPLPGLAMLYAPRGMGKTWLALFVAYALASGGSVFGWQASRPWRVLIIDGETPTGMLQERLARVVQGANTTLPDDDCLCIMVSDLIPEGMPSLTRPEIQAAVAALAAKFDVLIFDNLSTLAASLRENESDDWADFQAWLLALRRAGKLVLFVHHAGKTGQQRGTSRREDVLDTVIALKRPKDYEAAHGARFEVHIEKARGATGEALNPFLASLVEDENGCLTWVKASLADDQSKRAEALLRGGMTIRDVAEETGMSRSAVHRLRKNKNIGGSDAKG